MTELDFPSVRYVYDGLATRLGARVVVVPSRDGVGVDMDRLLAAIDERTALVAVSHVLFRSAYILDVAAICRRAHEVGARVSLDAFHSVGVMPVDVTELGVDFLSGGVLKWLCGGPGGAFLYASPEASKTLTPSFTGWQAHERPFGFESDMHYAEGAWRWLNGTPADSRAVRRGRRSPHRSARRDRRDPREEHSPDVASHRAGRRPRLPRLRAARRGSARRAPSPSTCRIRTACRARCWPTT